MEQEATTSEGNDGQRVLVVEDDPNMAVILKFNLEGAGYRVGIARDVLILPH